MSENKKDNRPSGQRLYDLVTMMFAGACGFAVAAKHTSFEAADRVLTIVCYIYFIQLLLRTAIIPLGAFLWKVLKPRLLKVLR